MPLVPVREYGSAKEMLRQVRLIHSGFRQALPPPVAPIVPCIKKDEIRELKAELEAKTEWFQKEISRLTIENTRLREELAVYRRVDDNAPNVLMRDIVKAVSVVFQTSETDIYSSRRYFPLPRVRQVAASLAKHLTRLSSVGIGRRLGGRDHTTILHACRKMRPILDAVAPQMGDSADPFEWARAMKEATGL